MKNSLENSLENNLENSLEIDLENSLERSLEILSILDIVRFLSFVQVFCWFLEVFNFW